MHDSADQATYCQACGRALIVGGVQVNQGLGQTPGHSYGGYNGIGREFSLEGMLESYAQRKNVTVNLTR
jgi:hypothetical protein